MSTNEIKIEEYKSLRSSIDMHMKLIPQIFALMVATTSAIFGYGINSKNPLVFLAPILIIIPCSYLILAQMNELMLKGTYILKKYEQDFQGWECTLFKKREFKERNKKRLISKAPEDALAFVLIIDLLLLLCFGGYLYFNSVLKVSQILSFLYPWKMVLVIAIAFIILILIILILNIGMLKAYTSEKEKEYSKILDELNKVN